MLDAQFPGQRVYRLRWRSKRKRDALSKRLIALARDPKPARVGIALAGKALQLWIEAVANSALAGQALADLVCRTTEESRFVLVGHSLGGRVMATALEALAARDAEPRVESAWLLGAAVEADDPRWVDRASATERGLFNGHADGDLVLRYLYRAGSFGGTPLGLGPFVRSHARLHDVNLAACVGANHSAYVRCLGQRLGG